jgi:hypothetical protein
MAPTDARSFDRYFVRATNKLNIQIATEGGTRISVSPHEKSETKSITFSPVINGADSPNRRNDRAQRHRRVRVQLQPVAHLVDCGTHEDGKLLATLEGHARRGQRRNVCARPSTGIPLASVGTLVLGLRCSWCSGSAPMPKLLGLYALPPARRQGVTLMKTFGVR